MPCYLCNSIQQNVRGVQVGDHLVQVGAAENSTDENKRKVTVTHHKCSECGAKWRHIDDNEDEQAGWRFVPPT